MKFNTYLVRYMVKAEIKEIEVDAANASLARMEVIKLHDTARIIDVYKV